LIGQDGHVTGIDMDKTQLELAGERARDWGLANVEFRNANVNDWNEPAAYDLVYCRLLLEHLSNPIDLLRRVWRAVKAGGMIVAEDGDFEGLFSHPPNEGYAFWADTYCRVTRRRGGDPAFGRKLYACFLEAGIPNPSVQLLQHARITGEAKSLSLLTLDATADAIVAGGIASESEVASARTSLDEATKDPQTVLGGPRIFQVWSRRDRNRANHHCCNEGAA
jgi:SAM-dependent methyltransferase